MGHFTNSIFGKFIEFFGGLIAKVIKGWKVSISVFSIIFIFFSSIMQSIQERTFLPFITQVGSRVLNADNSLYINSETIINAGGLTGEMSRWGFLKITTFFLVDIWILLLVAFIFYQLWRLRNSSAVGANITLALISLVVVQMFFSFYLITQDITKTHTYQEIGKEIIPFKGVGNFLRALPYLTGVQPTPVNLDEITALEVS